MYIERNASARRRREAENARQNRQEIARALTQGEITRRDMFRWGLLTAGGVIACKNGLSPFATSAYAQVPTGTPRSPNFGARKFTQPMPRPEVLKPIPMIGLGDGSYAFGTTGEPPARKFSYHQEFSESGGARARNPVTGRGPMEGRPPTEFFAHQRWEEIRPKVGYLLSVGQVRPGAKAHPLFPEQNANSVWTFGARPPLARGSLYGSRCRSAIPTSTRTCRNMTPRIKIVAARRYRSSSRSFAVVASRITAASSASPNSTPRFRSLNSSASRKAICSRSSARTGPSTARERSIFNARDWPTLPGTSSAKSKPARASRRRGPGQPHAGRPLGARDGLAADADCD